MNLLPPELDFPLVLVTEVASVLAKGYLRYRASLRKPFQDRADFRLDPIADFRDQASLGKPRQERKQEHQDQQQSRHDARHEPRHGTQHRAQPAASPAAQTDPPTSAPDTGLAFTPKQSVHVTVVNAQRKGHKGKQR